MSKLTNIIAGIMIPTLVAVSGCNTIGVTFGDSEKDDLGNCSAPTKQRVKEEGIKLLENSNDPISIGYAFQGFYNGKNCELVKMAVDKYEKVSKATGNFNYHKWERMLVKWDLMCVEPE